MGMTLQTPLAKWILRIPSVLGKKNIKPVSDIDLGSYLFPNDLLLGFTSNKSHLEILTVIANFGEKKILTM